MAIDKFYVTTPIYYVTAKPHLGTLYSTLLADVAARWNTLQGKRVFFLTGTDEHGQKIAQAAEKAGMAPKEFVDSFVPHFIDAWRMYDIHYTHFIRTTDKEHVLAVQNWLRKLRDQGDIYKATYQGWYCVSDETFVLEKEVGATPTDSGPLCPSCGRPTIELSEESYFFRLSAYQDRLLKLYEERPDFIIPKERAHEVISFVQSGLKDLSISRTTVKWGIPFPDDPNHVTYVWADALNNYITAIGYGQPGKEAQFKQWWPADLQVLGKDIIRFHAVYWPAFLMATGLEMPEHLLVHGWIKVDKQKMSKSFGNAIDPIELHKKYGTDPVRYYLMRQIAITHDSEFSIEDLEQKIGSDLADALGNLLNRLVSLAHKHDVFDIAAPEIWSEKAIDLRNECFNTIDDYSNYMQDCMYHMALSRLWRFIHSTNAYFHEHEPWKLAKQNREQFIQVLSATAHSLRAIALLLWPVMPKTMAHLLDSIGVIFDEHTGNDMIEELRLGAWQHHFLLKKVPMLFHKPEIKEMAPESNVQAATPAENKAPEQNYITIDDLVKVELVVGTIEQCEAVPNSEKLLKMQVDFGDKGKRQIIAGIRASYAPEQLVGKQGLFVLNLQPRKMAGLESQGMMLVAEGSDKLVKRMAPEVPVPNGTRLR
ncbi:MAG TPA: methionine--tRNA ligase [Candidatus Babeliales bacterium]|nr:methionine--tRNA ligase [Candidatus Babeliales bacterium]